LDFVIDYGFTQIVQFPTRGPNILDVVLVDNVHAVLNILHHPSFSSSDHVVVLFSLLFGNDCADSSLKSNRYCWYDANFDNMIGFLESINWLHVISSFPSVESMWTAFCQILKQAIDAFVPKCGSNGKPQSIKRLYPRFVRKELFKKRRLWNKCRSQPDNIIYRTLYRECCHKVRHSAPLKKHGSLKS